MHTRATWRSSPSTTCPTVRPPRRAPSATSAASSRHWSEVRGSRTRPLRARRAPSPAVSLWHRLADGREASGAAAELLAPKWFDKNPALTNGQNFDQLRSSLALARDAYLAGGNNTAFGHFWAHYEPQTTAAAARGLNALVACFGPALIDRALLDALCRALGISFYQAIRANV